LLVVSLDCLDLVVLVDDSEFACFKFLVQLVDTLLHFCLLREMRFESLFELRDVDWLLRLSGWEDDTVVCVVAVRRVQWSFAFKLGSLDG
jgi:hypothetical protein